MKYPKLLAVLFLALLADLVAADRNDYPQISFVVPGNSSSSVSRDQYLILVVEPGFISHAGEPISSEDLVAYVDTALKAQNASYIGVHIREGVRYGEVVKALDALRKTTTKSIGVSMAELPVGREP